MTLAAPIAACASVATWREGLRKHWGGDPLAEEPERLEALADFCAFVGEGPDSIVERCFRVRKTDGARVLSAKGRAHYAEKIKAFRSLDPARGARRAAAVLSFLIHNGVFIQA